MDTINLTVEERLSRISSRLEKISEILALSNKSVSEVVLELQRELEDIYISLGSAKEDDDADPL